MSAILYPIAVNAERALAAPLGRAAREREAERLAGAPVAFVREFTGPVFRSEEEARAAYAGRLDDDRPGARASIAPQDRFCELKPVVQRTLAPFGRPHAGWRLSIAYWRAGAAEQPQPPPPKAPQARKARRQKREEAPDPAALDAMARQPLLPIRAQKALDIGLFETRLPEAPDIVVPDE